MALDQHDLSWYYGNGHLMAKALRFVQEGLKENARVIAMIQPDHLRLLRASLEANGIPTRPGALESVQPERLARLRGLDSNGLRNEVLQELKRARTDGFSHVRVLVQVDYGLSVVGGSPSGHLRLERRYRQTCAGLPVTNLYLCNASASMAKRAAPTQLAPSPIDPQAEAYPRSAVESCPEAPPGRFSAPVADRPIQSDFLNSVKADGVPVSGTVLCVSVDNLVELNRTWGREAVDRVLNLAAERMRKTLRGQAWITRTGPEFRLWIEGLSGEEKVCGVTETVASALVRPFPIGTANVVLTCSGGAASSNHESISLEELIGQASLALHVARLQGKDRFLHFRPEMSVRAARQRDLQRDFAAALAAEEFALCYQPIVRLAVGAVVGLEALLRWNHPRLGLLDPSEFLPLLEQSGLIDSITQWVLDQGCRQIKSLEQSEPGRSLYLNVNLSDRQLRNPRLLAVLQEVLSTHQFPPGKLQIDINGGSQIEEDELSLAALNSMRAMGLRLALDGFGSPGTSLASLQRMPLSVVKIDGRLSQRLGSDSRDQALTGAVIHVARALGLEVVAEGVETWTQADQLRELGCEHVQGYFFARPISANELAASLVRSESSAAEWRNSAG